MNFNCLFIGISLHNIQLICGLCVIFYYNQILYNIPTFSMKQQVEITRSGVHV